MDKEILFIHVRSNEVMIEIINEVICYVSSHRYPITTKHQISRFKEKNLEYNLITVRLSTQFPLQTERTGF